MRIPMAGWPSTPTSRRAPTRAEVAARPVAGRPRGGGRPRRRAVRARSSSAGCSTSSPSRRRTARRSAGARSTSAGTRADGGPRGIVCGAANFAVGDLVVVALPGAVLPGGFEIAARKTYGHVSDGMICSARELDLGDDHAGILVLATIGLGPSEGAAPGADAVALLGLAEEVLEINVTPDRGYCFSLRGVAREYAHATGGAVPRPGRRRAARGARAAATRCGSRTTRRCAAGSAATATSRASSAASTRPRRRRTGCSAGCGQAGMRSISLAVDVTNYVMLATGQPLHAFDLRQADRPDRRTPGGRG